MQDNIRQKVMEKMNKAIINATTGELHRAVDFLEFAKKVRDGKKGNRSKARKESASSRIRKVDKPLSW